MTIVVSGFLGSDIYDKANIEIYSYQDVLNYLPVFVNRQLTNKIL